MSRRSSLLGCERRSGCGIASARSRMHWGESCYNSPMKVSEHFPREKDRFFVGKNNARVKYLRPVESLERKLLDDRLVARYFARPRAFQSWNRIARTPLASSLIRGAQLPFF